MSAASQTRATGATQNSESGTMIVPITAKMNMPTVRKRKTAHGEVELPLAFRRFFRSWHLSGWISCQRVRLMVCAHLWTGRHRCSFTRGVLGWRERCRRGRLQFFRGTGSVSRVIELVPGRNVEPAGSQQPIGALISARTGRCYVAAGRTAQRQTLALDGKNLDPDPFPTSSAPRTLPTPYVQNGLPLEHVPAE